MDIQHMSLTDIRPIYLGYDSKKDKYYFYIIKDVVPRFLSYTTYFLFDRGPENVLELKEIPEEIEVELVEFLSEKFHYEFKKPRKNSKNATSYKCYTSPVSLPPPQYIPTTDLEKERLENSNPGSRGRGLSGGTGLLSEVHAPSRSNDDEHGRKRRNKNGGPVTPTGISDGSQLESVKKHKEVRAVIAPVIAPVTVVEVKRRGRPRKVIETILEPIVGSYEGIPAKNTGRKRKAKI